MVNMFLFLAVYYSVYSLLILSFCITSFYHIEADICRIHFGWREYWGGRKPLYKAKPLYIVQSWFFFPVTRLSLSHHEFPLSMASNMSVSFNDTNILKTPRQMNVMNVSNGKGVTQGKAIFLWMLYIYN